MNRQIILLIAVLSLLLAELFIGQAQERIHPALEAPAGFVARHYSRDGREFNEHRMYPLGFSRRGDFAYLAHSANPWRRPTVYLRILNLVTDQQVLWENFDVGSRDADEGIRSLIAAQGKKITDILKKFDIVARPPAGIDQFPLHFDGDLLMADIQHLPLTGRSLQECGGRTPEEIEVRIKSTRKGVKTIASYDACASNTPQIEAIEGFLKSPLEDRIVVLASGTQYNSENQWDAKFFPIGAHLTAGFQPPP